VWQSVPASSTSTNPLRLTPQATIASAVAAGRERFKTAGMGGYTLTWIALPIFQLAMTGLIYQGVRPALLSYAVVGIAANAFIFNTLYFIGEILDEERVKGTLVGLFLAPCPRLCWLSGFSLVGLFETGLAAGATILFGRLGFGVRFHPDYPALLLAFLLFLASLWGMGFLFSAIGLAIKKSNDLSNLLSPFLSLLGGVYFPVALLPVWLRLPAHLLPIGYGIQAMAGAALHHRTIAQLAPDLVPLLAFAAALPLIGILAFAWVERRVRVRGELDLY
jgi:ABC-2 type transport system permease protein